MAPITIQKGSSVNLNEYVTITSYEWVELYAKGTFGTNLTDETTFN